MLLTVIAVATLLVAVVGATFAYFSLSVNDDSATTSATVNTGKVPTITVKGSEQKLNLKVTATDMVQGEEPIYYYAKTDDCTEQASCYDKGTSSVAEEQNYHDVLTVTVDGGDNETKYTCTGTIKVSSTDLSTINDLTTGDITIGLKNLNGTNDTEDMDAYAIKTNSNEKTTNLNFKFTGNEEKKVSAYVLLTNTTNPQNYLADKNITFTISSDDVNCEIDAAEE